MLKSLGLALSLCTGLSAANAAGSKTLSKEEVGTILGRPVTAVEGKSGHLIYKTASIYVEASIQVDEGDGVAAMVGARKATTMLGGTPEAVPGLGDEAFFGAMSTLYVRKGESEAIIQAPNYQQEAQATAMEKVQSAKGPDETEKAMAEFQALTKNDPGQAGLQGGDAMQGAMAVVNASSKKQGTPAEAKTRAMALALAKKLLEKL